MLALYCLCKKLLSKTFECIHLYGLKKDLNTERLFCLLMSEYHKPLMGAGVFSVMMKQG